MSTTFDPDAIEKHGWRQGAVLGPELLRAARERAPSGIAVADDNWINPPTAAWLYQFREVALHGRLIRVSRIGQPEWTAR